MVKIWKTLLSIAARSSWSSRIMDDPDCCSMQSHGDAGSIYAEKLLGDGSYVGNYNNKQANKKKKKKLKKVPKGCVPVVVNGEHTLAIKASRLSHPLLAYLLQQTAQDMGYTWHYPGALRLSCDPASFPHLLRLATPHNKCKW